MLLKSLISMQNELSSPAIPTNCKKLDEILNGGIHMRSVSDIYGAKFKTQFCLQLVINTIIPRPEGLIAGEVVWISTKDSAIFAHRLNELCNNYKKMYEINVDLMKFVHVQSVDNVSDLIFCVYDILELIKSNKRIRLVVIDSFAMLIRLIEDNKERIRIIYEICDVLDRISIASPCAVILVNDFVNDFGKESGSIKPALGDAFSHRINQRFYITETFQCEKIIINVQKNFANCIQGSVHIKFLHQIGFTDHEDQNISLFTNSSNEN